MSLLFSLVTEAGMAFAFCGVSLFFIILAGILRSLPVMMPLVGRLIAGVLTVSCQLYFLMLNPLAIAINDRWNQNILTGLLRWFTTTTISLALGCAIFWFLGWHITLLSLAMFALHGLVVGIIWNDIPGTDGLQMGATPTWPR